MSPRRHGDARIFAEKSKLFEPSSGVWGSRRGQGSEFRSPGPFKFSPSPVQSALLRQFCWRRCPLRASRPVHVHRAAIRPFDDFKKTHVRTVPRRRPSYSEFRSGLEKLRSYADTRELCHTVRFADVFSRPTVLVDGIDVKVTVRIPRIVLRYRT